MIVEIGIISIIKLLPHSKLTKIQEENQKVEKILYSQVQTRWVVFGAGMLLILYFMMVRFKTGEFYLYPWSERILLIVFGSWLVSIILTKKYLY